MIADHLVMGGEAPGKVTFEVMADSTKSQDVSTKSKLAALQKDDLDKIVMVDHLKGRTAFKNRLITKTLVITGILLSFICYYYISR